jgi:4-hydroxy-3-methylbut-2-enyl diphosphate reductase
VDLTCSVVKSVREKAVSLQRRHPAVIVVGKKDHPEVQGLVSYLKNPHVVTEPEEVPSLPEYPSVGVVEQTTIGRHRYERVHAALVEKYGADGVEALDTICPHTDENQSASREVAKRCDIILVVGDAHSSNSRRLLEVCREENPRSHFLSRAAEIDPSWFPPAGDERWEPLVVGITAGASTPDWTIEEIAAQVRQLAGLKE